MKLAIVWNVWNNYLDTLLGSELVRRLNQEQRVFESLWLISQGGYEQPPSDHEGQYLDRHDFIGVDESHELVKKHIRGRNFYRLFAGLKNAYLYGLEKNVDYVLVSNADAWPLNLHKLKDLLLEDGVRTCAVSIRLGAMLSSHSTYGVLAPQYDDHFMILNVELCKQFKVFDYEGPPRVLTESVLWEYGGYHYFISALFDDRVPQDKLGFYTHMFDCYNHFGEPSGITILPWQYQPSYEFLHANCAQDEQLNPLRAALLKYRGFERFPCTKDYIERHAVAPFPIRYRSGAVHYVRPFKSWLSNQIILNKNRLIGWVKQQRPCHDESRAQTVYLPGSERDKINLPHYVTMQVVKPSGRYTF